MERFVIAQNIAIFRAKLLTVKDECQRRTLLRLLAEEEAKYRLPPESKPADPVDRPTLFRRDHRQPTESVESPGGGPARREHRSS